MLDKIQIMDHLALRWGHNLPILPASLFEQCNNLQLLLLRHVLRGPHSVILSKTFRVIRLGTWEEVSALGTWLPDPNRGIGSQ